MEKHIKNENRYLRPDRPSLAKDLGITQQYLSMILANKRKARKVRQRLQQLLGHRAA